MQARFKLGRKQLAKHTLCGNTQGVLRGRVDRAAPARVGGTTLPTVTGLSLASCDSPRRVLVLPPSALARGSSNAGNRYRKAIHNEF
jgi:hypothetical protein